MDTTSISIKEDNLDMKYFKGDNCSSSVGQSYLFVI